MCAPRRYKHTPNNALVPLHAHVQCERMCQHMGTGQHMRNCAPGQHMGKYARGQHVCNMRGRVSTRAKMRWVSTCATCTHGSAHAHKSAGSAHAQKSAGSAHAQHARTGQQTRMHTRNRMQYTQQCLHMHACGKEAHEVHTQCLQLWIVTSPPSIPCIANPSPSIQLSCNYAVTPN